MEFPKRNREVRGKELVKMALEDARKKIKDGVYQLINRGATGDHYYDNVEKREFVLNKKTGDINILKPEQSARNYLGNGGSFLSGGIKNLGGNLQEIQGEESEENQEEQENKQSGRTYITDKFAKKR